MLKNIIYATNIDGKDREVSKLVRIKELRKEQGWSQQQLADLLFVNQTAVSQWERGATMPEPQTLLRLSSIFDVSTDYLLGRSDEKKPPASEDDERLALANASDETKLALELLNRLTPENRAKAMDHLDYLLDRQEGSEDKK